MFQKGFCALTLLSAISCGQNADFQKKPSATKSVQADFGDATLWLDPNKWIESSREPGIVRFDNINKHVLGWILSDKTAVV